MINSVARDRGWRRVLQRVFTNVQALAPALFLASPRSAKIDFPRRVNAKVVRQTSPCTVLGFALKTLL
jgi:hypothetical protein